MKDEDKTKKQLITESKRREEELDSNEKLVFDILNELPVGVAVVKGEDFEYTHANKFIARLNGISPEKHIEKTVKDVVHPIVVEGVVNNLQKVRDSGVGTQQRELEVPLPAGEVRTLLDWHYPLKGHDSILAVVVDITEQKKLEQQLRQAQKMEAIGILTGGIAHEFNNLLAPILGYTEMLMGDKSEDDSDLYGLEQIQIAGNRAKRLVQQLLAYGRQSLSQRESLQLENLVEDTIKLIENTIPSNISIKKEIEVSLPPILGMPNEIHQIILNLCINASHAMPDGGELTICLKKEGSRKFINSVGQKREGDFTGLSVQDTGSGMNKATLDRIFDPFFTTKDVGQGSGLGLSVVFGIVEQHEGHIEVDSKVGEGTTIHVYFPVAKEDVKPSVVKTESLSKGNERILLIDDEQMITNLTKRMLGKLGYKVTEFLDCVEALKLFTEHPLDFDLVIMDYGMPKMSGKQLAEKLKEIRPDIPTILFTGYGDLVAKEDIHTWGMDDLLMKPFEFKELSEVVRGVLGKRSAEA